VLSALLKLVEMSSGESSLTCRLDSIKALLSGAIQMLRNFLVFIAISVACTPQIAWAQDSRNVTEPRFPPVCRSLTAELGTKNGGIAESDESKPDTQRIQAAIDGCKPGTAVELRSSGPRTAFLSAPLELKQGVTLLVGANATLFASRNPRDYDVSPGSCGLVDHNGKGCRPVIHIAAARDAGVMGDGAIDGRGGAKLAGQSVSWWDLAQEAKVKKAAQNVPRIIVADQADGFVLYRITLRNSPNFNVIVSRTNGFTAWGVKIDSPKTARNTDGIDPSSSSYVSILHSYIHAGDDNVAIKAGSAGPSSHITVAHNHFYTGHGMSIGSETQGGVSAVEVRDLTIDGADNGIRIKSSPSRGGLVHDVAYRDVCIRDVKNPIVMETTYEGTTTGSLVPRFEDILLQNVRVFGGGKVSLEGFDSTHPLKMSFDGVELNGVQPAQIGVAHARISTGPGQVNFIFSGDDVEVLRLAGDHKVLSCDARFVPFPAGDQGTTTQSADATHNATTNRVRHDGRAPVVATDGSGDFRTIQQAVDALPDQGGTITIRPGTYREVVKIAKRAVRLEGDASDPSKVVIIFDKSAGTAGGTLNSATVEVKGDDFFARGITFANDFSQHNKPQAQGSQAIALAVSADRAVFRNVRVLGAQDTLFAGSKGCLSEQGPCVPARQFFSDCYIEGHVDFIFGDAKAVFANCEIHGIAHKTVMLTAQSKHYADEDSGYVFDHCKVTADREIEHIFLGRPWRPYATVVFLSADLEAPIDPAGWSEWHPAETHSLETATYAEFQSTGPGANAASRDPHSKQLTVVEAARYLPRAFLAGSDGWNPFADGK
jgi:polygalacturonase